MLSIDKTYEILLKTDKMHVLMENCIRSDLTGLSKTDIGHFYYLMHLSYTYRKCSDIENEYIDELIRKSSIADFIMCLFLHFYHKIQSEGLSRLCSDLIIAIDPKKSTNCFHGTEISVSDLIDISSLFLPFVKLQDDSISAYSNLEWESHSHVIPIIGSFLIYLPCIKTMSDSFLHHIITSSNINENDMAHIINYAPIKTLLSLKQPIIVSCKCFPNPTIIANSLLKRFCKENASKRNLNCIIKFCSGEVFTEEVWKYLGNYFYYIDHSLSKDFPANPSIEQSLFVFRDPLGFVSESEFFEYIRSNGQLSFILFESELTKRVMMKEEFWVSFFHNSGVSKYSPRLFQFFIDLYPHKFIIEYFRIIKQQKICVNEIFLRKLFNKCDEPDKEMMVYLLIDDDCIIKRESYTMLSAFLQNNRVLPKLYEIPYHPVRYGVFYSMNAGQSSRFARRFDGKFIIPPYDNDLSGLIKESLKYTRINSSISDMNYCFILFCRFIVNSLRNGILLPFQNSMPNSLLLICSCYDLPITNQKNSKIITNTENFYPETLKTITLPMTDLDDAAFAFMLSRFCFQAKSIDESLIFFICALEFIDRILNEGAFMLDSESTTPILFFLIKCCDLLSMNKKGISTIEKIKKLLFPLLRKHTRIIILAYIHHLHAFFDKSSFRLLWKGLFNQKCFVESITQSNDKLNAIAFSVVFEPGIFSKENIIDSINQSIQNKEFWRIFPVLSNFKEDKFFIDTILSNGIIKSEPETYLSCFISLRPSCVSDISVFISSFKHVFEISKVSEESNTYFQMLLSLFFGETLFLYQMISLIDIGIPFMIIHKSYLPSIFSFFNKYNPDLFAKASAYVYKLSPYDKNSFIKRSLIQYPDISEKCISSIYELTLFMLNCPKSNKWILLLYTITNYLAIFSLFSDSQAKDVLDQVINCFKSPKKKHVELPPKSIAYNLLRVPVFRDVFFECLPQYLLNSDCLVFLLSLLDHQISLGDSGFIAMSLIVSRDYLSLIQLPDSVLEDQSREYMFRYFSLLVPIMKFYESLNNDIKVREIFELVSSCSRPYRDLSKVEYSVSLYEFSVRDSCFKSNRNEITTVPNPYVFTKQDIHLIKKFNENFSKYEIMIGDEGSNISSEEEFLLKCLAMKKSLSLFSKLQQPWWVSSFLNGQLQTKLLPEHYKYILGLKSCQIEIIQIKNSSISHYLSKHLIMTCIECPRVVQRFFRLLLSLKNIDMFLVEFYQYCYQFKSSVVQRVLRVISGIIPEKSKMDIFINGIYAKYNTGIWGNAPHLLYSMMKAYQKHNFPIDDNLLRDLPIVLLSKDITNVYRGIKIVSYIPKKQQVLFYPIIKQFFSRELELFNVKKPSPIVHVILEYLPSICDSFIDDLYRIARDILDQYMESNVYLLSCILEFLCPEPVETTDSIEGSFSIPKSLYLSNPRYWSLFTDHIEIFKELHALEGSRPDEYDDYEEDSNEQEGFLDLFPFFISFPCLCPLVDRIEHFKIKVSGDGDSYETAIFSISRNNIFEDSIKNLKGLYTKPTPNVYIEYFNESYAEQGGPLKNWFTLFGQQLIENSVLINLDGGYYLNSNYSNLEVIQSFGQYIALSFFHQCLIPMQISPCLFKLLKGIPFKVDDIACISQQLFKSLLWIADDKNDPSELGIYFVVQDNDQEIELVLNGKDILVTKDNKLEYSKLIVEYFLLKNIQPQVKSFLDGFNSVYTTEHLKSFSIYEIISIICGQNVFDIEDFVQNVHFDSSIGKNSPLAEQLISVVKGFDHQQQKRFLMFITGSTHLPIGGFATLKKNGNPVRITRSPPSKSYPYAYTCYNEFSIPNYSSVDEMREKLLEALMFCESY